MVFFCPDCLYSLGINKATNLNDDDDDRKEIANINDVFKLLTDTDINLLDYKATFPKNDILKNKKYQKLSMGDKTKLNQLFINKLAEAELSCGNCGYKKQINETIKLYEFNVTDKLNNIKTFEDNKLLALDPTLPRTRDYTCKNINCSTHKSKELKEAVFMRVPKTYNLTYICTTCNYSWNTV
jgi:hypothetical protein|uniref:TFIIS-type domain-containing protein n=1 Tax=viral metagenome TaxID=1070528 RepID=A0A6C0ITU0_9ZZZZ